MPSIPSTAIGIGSALYQLLREKELWIPSWLSNRRYRRDYLHPLLPLLRREGVVHTCNASCRRRLMMSHTSQEHESKQTRLHTHTHTYTHTHTHTHTHTTLTPSSWSTSTEWCSGVRPSSSWLSKENLRKFYGQKCACPVQAGCEM